MDVLNKNNKEVTYKEFKFAYEKLIKTKKGNLTVENAEAITKAFKICYEFVLKVMEIKIVEVEESLSLPKYLLVMAAKYNLINDLEIWMIFYNMKDKLVRDKEYPYKGKVAFSIMKILPIFKIKADEIIRSFEVKNKAIDNL